MNNQVPHERLLEILDYNPDTGLFVWKVNFKGRFCVGLRAGSERCGYRQITIDQVRYLEHRLAWFYVHEQWPSNLIDHKDLNKTNNAIANLREATHSQNKANRRAPENNTTGFKGVSFSKAQRKWQASICREYNQKHLGFFDTPEMAHAAYLASCKELFGEFARA